MSKKLPILITFFIIFLTIFIIFFDKFLMFFHNIENTSLIISISSVIVSVWALNHTLNKEKIAKFDEKFILLLEQHNELHKKLAEYLTDEMIYKNNNLFSMKKKYKENSNSVYNNFNFSPYMRILYQLLKHVDDKFYKKKLWGFSSEYSLLYEKKEYTSMLRSLIRNDVLFFVGINVCKNDSSKYHEMLTKFEIFKHLNTSQVNEYLTIARDDIFKDFLSEIKSYITSHMNSEIVNKMNSIFKEDKKANNNNKVKLYTDSLTRLYFKFKKEEYYKLLDLLLAKVNEEVKTIIENNSKPIEINDTELFLSKIIEKNDGGNYCRYSSLNNNKYLYSEQSKIIEEQGESFDDFIKRINSKGERVVFTYGLIEEDNYPMHEPIRLEKFYNECYEIVKNRIKLDVFSNHSLIDAMKTKILKILNDTDYIFEQDERIVLSGHGEFYDSKRNN